MIKDESRVDEVLEQLAKLTSKEVAVGIVDSGAVHNDGETKILDIAKVHEFGFIGKDKNGKKMNIPERSFIRGTFDDKKKDIISRTETELLRVVNLEVDGDQMLDGIGRWGADLTQEYITDLKSPPLKPATIKQTGRSNPLIDTGALRDKIEFKVGDSNK